MNTIKVCCFKSVSKESFEFWMLSLEHILMMCACQSGRRTICSIVGYAGIFKLAICRHRLDLFSNIFNIFTFYFLRPWRQLRNGTRISVTNRFTRCGSSLMYAALWWMELDWSSMETMRMTIGLGRFWISPTLVSLYERRPLGKTIWS